MRVSCGCPKATARSAETLINWIKQVGLQPIVTNTTIRCVYEGDNRALGEAIVEMFEVEVDHDVTVFYSEEEQQSSARRAERKNERKTARHKH